MRRPRAILLDLDDTILDDTGPVDKCWTDATALAEKLLPGLSATGLRQAIDDYASWWWSDPKRNQQGRLDLRRATANVVAECLRRLGLEDEAAAATIANCYRDLREERARLHEGAVETIRVFMSRGIRLGLMTNGAGPAQRAKIERFGLAQYFGQIVIEGEFGVGKPHPRVFESLMTGLGVEPSETWAVGDNLEADVRGAMDLGIYGIWVDQRGWELPEGTVPDRIIHELRELASDPI